MSTENLAQTAQATNQADKATTTDAAPAIASTEEKKTEAAPPAPVVPDKYDLKRGENSLYSDSQLTALADYAKANKLTNEQAQTLLSREESGISAYVESQNAALKQKSAQWIEESKGDKEIGGEALNKNVELTKRFVGKFFDPSVAKFLNETGYGNQKEIIRGFVKIMKAAGFAEDTLVVPGTHSSGERSTAELFYGKKEASG